VAYLLDTNAWVWAVEAPEQLGRSARAALGEANHLPFLLSAISLWEVAKLVEKQRIVLTIPIEKWLARALRPEFIRVVPLSPEVAIASTQLPGNFHRDPADQIIVATARCHDATLITADGAIQAYPYVRSRWA